MAHDWNLFDRRLRVLREFDDARQTGVALDDALEEFAEDALDLAVNQIVNLELVEPGRFFQLPRAGAADDDLRFVLKDRRMRDDAYELVRVQRHQALPGQF